MLHSLASQGFNTACNPATLAGCIPFSDMDANYSNGTSDYNGFSANLRKRFNRHFEFLASYTWSHAIDDSTDLQATLTPQDSYYPNRDRSTSLFDQRHRFVFSGVYQLASVGRGFSRKVFSNWTFAPLIEFGSGRPFNIITGNDDNLQLSSLTGRPNTFVNSRALRWDIPRSRRSSRRPEFSRSRARPGSTALCSHWMATSDVMPECSPGPYSTTSASPSAFTSPSATTWN